MTGTREWLVGTALVLASVAVRADQPAAASVLAGDDTVAAFAAATPLPAAALGELAGKAQLHVDKIQVNDQELTGTVTDNVALNNQTGHNTIASDAYNNAAGFITTIQNTGNNVLIQNATIINLTVEP